MIMTTQSSGQAAQTATNKILAEVVAGLEAAHAALGRAGQGGGQGQARLSAVCDQLGAAVTSLLGAQDELASGTSSSLVRLDRLIRTAGGLIREDELSARRKRAVAVLEPGGSGGPAGKRCLTLVAGQAGRGSPAHQDSSWEPPDVRQPSVMVRHAVLTARQKADLRKFSGEEVNVKEELPGPAHTELKDEFASPEK